MKNDEMKAELQKFGVEFPEDAKAPELRQLLREASAGTQENKKVESGDIQQPAQPVATPASEDALEAARAEGRAQAEAEAKDKVEGKREELDADIKALRAKKSKEPDDKERLRRLMAERARMNNEATLRDLTGVLPSHMTKEEMERFCKEHEIECKKGDTTTMLRARIKAFRNPGYAEKLALLESAHLAGRIVR